MFNQSSHCTVKGNILVELLEMPVLKKAMIF